MNNYLKESSKSSHVQKMINEALDILHSVGMPFEGKTEKALQSMSMFFLAVAGFTKNWKEALIGEPNFLMICFKKSLWSIL